MHLMPRPLPLLTAAVMSLAFVCGCGSSGSSSTKVTTAKAANPKAVAQAKKKPVGFTGYDIIPESGQANPTVDSVGAEVQQGFVMVAQSPNPKTFPEAFGNGGLDALLTAADEQHINLSGGGSVTWNWFAPANQASAARQLIDTMRVRYGIKIQLVGQ